MWENESKKVNEVIVKIILMMKTPKSMKGSILEEDITN